MKANTHIQSPPSTSSRGSERRSVLLEVASTLFLNHGYSNVSLDQIVEQAGGSKASIYKYFGNKQGLFFAICLERCNHFIAHIERAFQQQQSDFRSQLQKLLNDLLVVFIEEKSTSFAKLLVQVSPENPDIAQQLYDHGPKNAQRLLAKYLQKAHDQELIYCTNPYTSASYLLGFFHNYHWRITLGLPALEADEQPEDSINYIIDRFIEGHQPPISKT